MNNPRAQHPATHILPLLCTGACLLPVMWGAASAQSHDDVKQVQEALVEYGIGITRTDGVFDQSTRRAIEAYQRDWKLAGDGRITPELIERLSRRHRSTRPQWRKVSNQNCMVWSARPNAREVVTWSGECTAGRATGQGALRMSWTIMGQTRHIEFKGAYNGGRANGDGDMVYASGARYTGQFKDGHRSGLGHYRWPDGTEYRGYFAHGFRHGNGIALFTNGDRYAGRWQQGRPHGDGTFFPSQGDAEERTWTHGCSTLRGRNRWLFTSRTSCGF